MVDQQTHVFRVLAPTVQLPRKAVDRHIGDSEEPMEYDSEVAAEFFLIPRFKLCLWRRQRRTYRIVNQIQLQFAAITEAIERLQRLNALGKNSGTPLLLDIFA